MKLAIMQPYLFPYLPYFQLIKSVDIFVVFDDVAYRKGGWINRNNLLRFGSSQLTTMPILGGSSNRLINQIKVGNDNKKILKTIWHCYSRAPYFHSIYPLLEEILIYPYQNLAFFLANQLKIICGHLGIKSRQDFSSVLGHDAPLKGQERIISICKGLDANQLILSSGGVSLYCPDLFLENAIKLSFLKPKPIFYKQFKSPFVPNLSIIDVLMFNGAYEVRELLERYDIIDL